VNDGDRILAVVPEAPSITMAAAVASLRKQQGSDTPHSQACEQGSYHPGRTSHDRGARTGTSLGDPIEMKRSAKSCVALPELPPVAIGSVKNKPRPLPRLQVDLQVFSKQRFPFSAGRSLSIFICIGKAHSSRGNSARFVPTTLQEWVLHPSRKRRVAGVSSFGFSGTNAHVLIEEYLPPIPEAHESRPNLPGWLLFPHKSEEPLMRHSTNYRNTLPAIRIPPLNDFCQT